jgi:hypothetical protein
MAYFHSPRIVTDSLLLYIDAANQTPVRYGNTSLTPNGGASSPSNGYYSFDGTDDGFEINSSVYNTTYDGKTILVAARMSSLFGSPNLFRAFLGTNGAVSSRNFNFYMYRDGTGFRFHYSSGPASSLSSYLSLNLNQWFIGGVTHTLGGGVTYYLNGVAAGTATQTFSQYNSGVSEFIGKADNFWNGDIAYWSVYKRALSAAEIQQNYNATKGRYGL